MKKIQTIIEGYPIIKNINVKVNNRYKKNY